MNGTSNNVLLSKFRVVSECWVSIWEDWYLVFTLTRVVRLTPLLSLGSDLDRDVRPSRDTEDWVEVMNNRYPETCLMNLKDSKPKE